MPARVDLRNGFPPVRSQRGLQSCLAIGICDAMAYGSQRSHAESCDELSSLFLYYNARQRTGHSNLNVAVRPRDALAAAEQYGVCWEANWPYEPDLYRERPPRQAYDQADTGRRPRFEAVPQRLPDLQACLNEDVPFLFCLRLFPSNRYLFENEGRAVMPREGEPQIRNHGLLAVGYDDTTQSFLARNSFGTEWGDGGYVSVPYDYVAHPGFAYAFWRIRG